MSNPIRWRGQSAVYTPVERQIMAALPVREQACLHLLKALTLGEIGAAVEKAEGSTVEVRPAPICGPRGVADGVEAAVDEAPIPVYTNPEDLEFGTKPKRRPKIYAVVWTWRKHKVHKTKKRCEQRLKVWKRWYERQGWKVTSYQSGYIAVSPAGERHAIVLHEYDAETHARLN